MVLCKLFQASNVEMELQELTVTLQVYDDVKIGIS